MGADGDAVIATGEAHSVRELCEIAFARVGQDWERYVVIDKTQVRPAEVDHLIGDTDKARRVLGWTPKVSFRNLVEMMVDADVEAGASATTESAWWPSSRSSPGAGTPAR